MKTRLLSILIILLVISCKKTSVTETEQPPVNPGAPSSLSASLVSQNGFQLNWLFSGTDSVKVFVARDSLFTQPVNGFNGVSTKELKLSVTGLSPDSAYFCQVRTKTGLSSPLLKVATLACSLLTISADRDPVTIPDKQLEMQYDNQNRIIKTIVFASNGSPSLTSDISYASNGTISGIKETNNLSAGAVFDINVQGNIITGKGKRQSNSVFDSLRIEMTASGFAKIERLVSAFLTGAAPFDTVKIITERSFSYDNAGVLTKSVQRETNERVSASGVKQSTSFSEKEFTYQYLNGNLQKVQFSERTQANANAVLKTIIEFQHDLNRVHPSNFLLGNGSGSDNLPGMNTSIRARVNFPAIATNPVNLIKSIKTIFQDPVTTFSQTDVSFEYGFRDNKAFPQTVRRTETLTRRSDGVVTQSGTPFIFFYQTNCN